MARRLADDTVLRALLQGPDGRSLARSAEAIELVLARPILFDALMRMLRDEDALVAMRAADAAEKITSSRRDWLTPYKEDLLGLAAMATGQELRWHLAQLLPRLPLRSEEREKVFLLMLDYLEDRSSIVKTCALQALADLAQLDPALRARVLPVIERHAQTGTPAMRARARSLMPRLGSTSRAKR